MRDTDAARQPSHGRPWHGRRKRCSWAAPLLFLPFCSTASAATEPPWDGRELLPDVQRKPEASSSFANEAWHGAPSACDGVSAPEALSVPLLATCAKARMLQKFWEGRAAVAYWHIQKTGGTTVCNLAIKYKLYADRYFDEYPGNGGAAQALRATIKDNCRFGYLNDSICDALGKRRGVACQHFASRVAAWPPQLHQGRRFFAMEPEGYPSFPHYWYAMEWFADAAHPFWRDWVHVLTVRDPAERFFSDFKQRGFHDYCARAKLPLQRCVGLMLHDPDALEQALCAHGMAGPLHLYTVRHRLLANMLVAHLSGTPADAALAKRNARRMSLVLDIKERAESSTFLVQRVWAENSSGLSFAEAHRRAGSNVTFRSLYPELYGAVKERLALDFEVWKYALELIDSHAASLGFVTMPADAVN
ncbi:unnamed protein product [Phaeothamnion confervicola]